MDGDTRRVWKCPECGSTIRLPVNTVAATCDSCKNPKSMNIEFEPVLKRFVPPSTDMEDVTEGPPNSSASGVVNVFPPVEVSNAPKRKRGPRHRKKRGAAATETSADSASAETAPESADAANSPDAQSASKSDTDSSKTRTAQDQSAADVAAPEAGHDPTGGIDGKDSSESAAE